MQLFFQNRPNRRQFHSKINQPVNSHRTIGQDMSNTSYLAASHFAEFGFVNGSDAELSGFVGLGTGVVADDYQVGFL